MNSFARKQRDSHASYVIWISLDGQGLAVVLFVSLSYRAPLLHLFKGRRYPRLEEINLYRYPTVLYSIPHTKIRYGSSDERPCLRNEAGVVNCQAARQDSLLGAANVYRSLSHSSQPEPHIFLRGQFGKCISIGLNCRKRHKAGCKSLLRCVTIELGNYFKGVETCFRIQNVQT